MEKILIPNGLIAEKAIYKEQKVYDYQNNPFIEALPSLFTNNQVIEKLAFYPQYDARERQLETHYRIHLINRLYQVFQPTPLSIELESKVSCAIRQGYIMRNNYSPQMVQGYYRDHNIINDLNHITSGNFIQTSSGFSLVGISGIGKTTSLDRILNMYPQIIVHTEYNGVKFSNYQICYIKLECPFDGSVKGLLFQFFSEVDRLLGTVYYQKAVRSRPTTDILLSTANQIMRNINLGFFVIDEIQNLNVAKLGSEKMINLLVSLNTNANIPLLIVGNPSALGILQSTFRNARRGVGQGGDMVCNRISKGVVWDILVNAIWGYQWTQKESPLTDGIRDVLYDETQGIPDLLKKVYAISQAYAITSGREEITVSIIRKICKEHLKLIQPMISALRSGDIRKIAKYDDICIIDTAIDDFINKSRQSIDVDIRAKSLRKKQADIDASNFINIKEQAVIKLMELGIDTKKAQKTVDYIVDNANTTVDINSTVIKAISILSNGDSLEINMKEKKKVSNPNDIRLIVKKEKEDGKSAYEALIENGYIKKFEDDIFGVGW